MQEDYKFELVDQIVVEEHFLLDEDDEEEIVEAVDYS